MTAGARRAFGTREGRWTLVSTGLTAATAISVAILASNAVPPSAARTYEPKREQAALPYDLLVRLSGISSVPGITAERNRRADSIENDAATGNLDDRAISEQESASEPGIDTRTLTVDDGDTVMGMLSDAGVTVETASDIVEALRPVFNPRQIKAGQVFTARFDKSTSDIQLLSLSFSPNLEQQVVVSLQPDGSYTADKVQKPLDVKYQHAGATIDTSLYLAAMQAGIPASVVVEMIRMFSYDVDFQRDLRSGDKFDVLFSRYYTPEGVAARDGSIKQASMTLSGVTHTLYSFTTEDGVEYFDEKGRSAKSLLMKTPVDGARISSGFGMRLHPVLGYTRMHKGIDFAVPTGTPVMAAGSGTISLAGKENGYGNIVVVQHANGYSTAYAHLSRFAAGIKSGTHVRQGQIIAYSGMSGMATGPHLHYEIRVNNQQVNPLNVKVASGRQLQGAEMKAFKAEVEKTGQLIASLPMQRKVAAASVLRTAE
jgi:murein DD-endopeptidase MepM/ murein hydrolase activator NlpD